jgi:hypothetical protein
MIIIPTSSPSVAQSTDSIAVSTSSAPTTTTIAAYERDLRSMAELERYSQQGDREGGRRNNSHDGTSVLRSHQKRSEHAACLSRRPHGNGVATPSTSLATP